MCAHMCVHRCVWRPEEILLKHHILAFSHRDFHWSETSQVGWSCCPASSEDQLVCLPSTDIPSVHHHAQCFHMGSGIGLRPSYLHSKALIVYLCQWLCKWIGKVWLNRIFLSLPSLWSSLLTLMVYLVTRILRKAWWVFFSNCQENDPCQVGLYANSSVTQGGHSRSHKPVKPEPFLHCAYKLGKDLWHFSGR